MLGMLPLDGDKVKWIEALKQDRNRYSSVRDKVLYNFKIMTSSLHHILLVLQP